MEAILFDLDGTLIDSAEDIAAAANHALESLGLQRLPTERIRGFVGDGAHKLMQRSMGASSDRLEEAVELFRSYYLEHPTSAATLSPAMRALLEELSSSKLAVVTNKPLSITERILSELGIRALFERVSGAESYPEIKPSPLPLLRTLEAMDASIATSAMVGDAPQDLQAGRSAGVFTCAVSWGFTPRERLLAERPDALVDDLAALKKALCLY